MATNAPGFAIDDASADVAPLTAAEKAAVRRAEADAKAGRVHDHDDVAAWLRERAVEIVKRATKSTE